MRLPVSLPKTLPGATPFGLSARRGVAAPAVPFDPATSLAGPLAQWKFDETSGLWARNSFDTTTRSANLAPVTEQILSTVFAAGSAATVTDGQADPNGGTAATRISLASGSRNAPGYAPAAGTYTVSLYIKSNTGVSITGCRLYVNFGGFTITNFTATTSYQRISVTFTVGGATSGTITVDANGAACDVLVYGLQLELGSSATAYQTPRLDIGYGSTAPTLSSVGVNVAGLKRGTALFGGGSQTLSACTVYALYRNTGTPSFSGYSPLIATSNQSFFAGSQFQQDQPQLVAGGQRYYGGEQAPTSEGGWHTACWTAGASGGNILIDGHWTSGPAAAPGSIVIPYLQFSNVNDVASFWGDIAYLAFFGAEHTVTEMRLMTDWMEAILVARGGTVYPKKFVGWEGDSITNGIAGTDPHWFRKVAQAASFPTVKSASFAVPGARLKEVPATDGNTLVDRAARVKAAPRPGSRSVLHVLVGANGGTIDPAVFVSDLTAYVADMKTAYTKVVVATVLPQTNVGFTANRPAMNAGIVAGVGQDATTRFDLDPNIGPDAAASNGTYFSDGLHLTSTGHDTAGGVAGPVVAGQID